MLLKDFLNYIDDNAYYKIVMDGVKLDKDLLENYYNDNYVYSVSTKCNYVIIELYANDDIVKAFGIK